MCICITIYLSIYSFIRQSVRPFVYLCIYILHTIKNRNIQNYLTILHIHPHPRTQKHAHTKSNWKSPRKKHLFEFFTLRFDIFLCIYNRPKNPSDSNRIEWNIYYEFSMSIKIDRAAMAVVAMAVAAYIKIDINLMISTKKNMLLLTLTHTLTHSNHREKKYE